MVAIFSFVEKIELVEVVEGVKSVVFELDVPRIKKV